MPAGNGRQKTKGRSLNVLSTIKRSIVVVKAAFLCFLLSQARIIATPSINGDPKYNSYRDGYLMDKPVEELLRASGVDLSNGEGLQELQQFQDYL